jgi:hypothetical protein
MNRMLGIAETEDLREMGSVDVGYKVGCRIVFVVVLEGLGRW